MIHSYYLWACRTDGPAVMEAAITKRGEGMARGDAEGSSSVSDSLLMNGGSSQLTARYTRTHLYPIAI